MAMSMLSPRREASIRSTSSARIPPSVTTFRRPSSVLAAEGAEVGWAAAADREDPRLTAAAGVTCPLAPMLAAAPGMLLDPALGALPVLPVEAMLAAAGSWPDQPLKRATCSSLSNNGNVAGPV